MLEKIVGLTGGKAYFPGSIYDLERICDKIALELKHQYVLGYVSTNASRDGKWRKVRVKVNVPDLNVRAKRGYHAPLK